MVIIYLNKNIKDTLLMTTMDILVVVFIWTLWANYTLVSTRSNGHLKSPANKMRFTKLLIRQI